MLGTPEKAPAAERQGPRSRARLEEDLQPELHVEGFAGADTGGSVEVADGVGDDAAAGARRADARSQIDAIEGIEGLDTELGFDPFCDRDVLEHRQIHVGEARSVNLVAAQVAQESRAWLETS